ncbi:MAG: Crp/Fnr family transcriptional regulator [Flavobacterium sp.]
MERLREHIEAITPISDEEFDYISSFFTLKKVRKNQFLIHEGDEVKYDYLVLSGVYKVFYVDESSKEHILQFAQKNWWMSDYPAFFRQINASVYIECINAGEVLCITLHSREKLASEMHKIEHFFRVKLTNGFVSLTQRIRLLLSSTPQQRYLEFSKSYPDLMQQIPKKYIAEFLGVSRETLSRFHTKNSNAK